MISRYTLARLIVKLFYKKGYTKNFLLEDIYTEEYNEHIRKQTNINWDV